MGTFHTFVSQPFMAENEAEQMKEEFEKKLQESNYINYKDRVRIVPLGSFFIVVGLYKNVGGVPYELETFKSRGNWATVSDEGDFYDYSKAEY